MIQSHSFFIEIRYFTVHNFQINTFILKKMELLAPTYFKVVKISSCIKKMFLDNIIYCIYIEHYNIRKPQLESYPQ